MNANWYRTTQKTIIARALCILNDLGFVELAPLPGGDISGKWPQKSKHCHSTSKHVKEGDREDSDLLIPSFGADLVEDASWLADKPQRGARTPHQSRIHMKKEPDTNELRWDIDDVDPTQPKYRKRPATSLSTPGEIPPSSGVQRTESTSPEAGGLAVAAPEAQPGVSQLLVEQVAMLVVGFEVYHQSWSPLPYFPGRMPLQRRAQRI